LLEKAGIRKKQVRNERGARNEEMLKNILKKFEREKKRRNTSENKFKYNINYKIIIKEKFSKYLKG